MSPQRLGRLSDLSEGLRSGRCSSRELVEHCLAAAADGSGEGARVFTRTYDDAARAAADRWDALRRSGQALPPHAGIPVSIKDLFDVQGEATLAGSRILAEAPPAPTDALVVQRLRAAGLIVIGKTNMSEFAFTGLGINPHLGTPRNPFRRDEARLPGGSSSGAAVSVSDGMAAGGIGTDTGGSCRIPAALCGLTGFKPTAQRVPTDGSIPLSPSLDSIGAIANSVDCCATLDAILAGETAPSAAPSVLAGKRFAVPRTLVLDDLDAGVARAFDAALRRLREAGAGVESIALAELAELPHINRKGGFPAVESYAWHRRFLPSYGALYDPRVLARIMRGSEQGPGDHQALVAARTDLQSRIWHSCKGWDALLMPTVPIVAPAIADMADPDVHDRSNLLLLRNPSLVNFLDGCAVSIPVQPAGESPVGLTLFGPPMADQGLLALARAVEQQCVLAPPPYRFP